MPALPTNNAPPSTITAVIRQVIDAFDACGEATIVQVGAQFRDQFGVGNGPKVLFVLEPDGAGGAIASATRMGNAAKQVHSCDVYVRAAEPSTDVLECHDALCELNDFVVDLVRTAGTGRTVLGACSDDSPLKTPSGVGTGFGWSFTFERDIQHGARRWRGPVRDAAGHVLETPLTAPADTSAPTLPTSPAAVLSDGVTTIITATSEE